MSHAGFLNNAHGDFASTYTEDIGSATPSGGILEILGGPGIITSGSGNIITITATGSGFTWNVVTSVSPANPIQVVTENGYICTGAAEVTFILPLAPAIGDTYKFFSYSSKFRINQNANQLIQIGAAATTIGATGFLESNSIGDALVLVYMGSNTFQDESIQGTLTLN
jgi:hypothetical protein